MGEELPGANGNMIQIPGWQGPIGECHPQRIDVARILVETWPNQHAGWFRVREHRAIGMNRYRRYDILGRTAGEKKKKQ